VPTTRADLTSEQRIVLDTVFEVFRDNAKWPTFDYVDKRVYDSHGLELREVLESLPPGLVIYNRYGQPEETLPLRMAGVACCEHPEGVIRTFLRMLAWCVDKQQAHNPLPFEKTDAPTATAKDAVKDWTNKGWEVSDLIVEHAFELMKIEGLHGGWSFNANEPLSWSIVLPKELRAYKDVKNLEDYFQRRESEIRRLQQRSPVGQAVQALHRAVDASAGMTAVTPAHGGQSGASPATPVPAAATRNDNLDDDQRDVLVRMICDVLCSRTRTEIGQFLDRYGLKPDQYSFGRFGYAKSSVQNAQNLAILAMCEELQIDIQRWPSEVLNPWKPARFRLFFSHSSDDHELVAKIAEALESYGIYGFVAHKDIKPQANWEDVIEYALGTADAMVALVNDKFAASSYCNQEVGWGLGRGLVCASIMMGLSPVGFTKRFQGIQHSSDPVAQARQIFDVLAEHRKTSALMADNLVAKLEESNTWEEASALAPYLPKCKRWSATALVRLADAVRYGPKVSQAWGIPDAVEAVFAAAREELPSDLRDVFQISRELEREKRRRI
jgi:hypothetical protein